MLAGALTRAHPSLEVKHFVVRFVLLTVWRCSHAKCAHKSAKYVTDFFLALTFGYHSLVPETCYRFNETRNQSMKHVHWYLSVNKVVNGDTAIAFA